MTEDAARIAELEADNRRLRRLLDQRDAPGELRHRLRSTLAMLRTVIRKSADTQRDLEAYVAHVEDRVDALARAQAAADARGCVDLHGLLADELLHYGASEGERVSLSGRPICLQPRPGQVLGLAIHELAVNALEHGALGTGGGRIEIGWAIAAGTGGAPLTLTWKERGLSGLTAPASQGFGREVLTRMIPYELRADTALAFEPDGLRCTIAFALSERVGRVADE